MKKITYVSADVRQNGCTTNSLYNKNGQIIMPFEKGNKLGEGRPKGSRNKANLLAEAMDAATKNELGSNDGPIEILTKLIERLDKEIRNNTLSVSQTMEALKVLAPYFGAKHTSQKAEKTINDNSISTAMQMELQEMKFKQLELEAENRRLEKLLGNTNDHLNFAGENKMTKVN